MKKFSVSVITILTTFLLSALFVQAADKPNIVIFLADDLGWADVGWHGTEIKTPNLDKLASAGLRLEQFYVHPLCTPTRACLLTGRFPIRYGLQQGVITPGADYGLPTEERTLADALREAGYYTAITGKWHLGEADKKYLPLQRGFDYLYGLYNWGIDYYKHIFPRLGGLDWHRNGKAVEETGYSTDLIANEATKVIQEHDTKKPLFLYVPFNAVHGPYLEAPDKELNAQYDHLKGTRKTYAGMVASLDANVGRIVKALEEKGIRDNTIIFFSSDNGGPKPKEITDNGPLRGGKATMYEGGLRVPAFVVWNGKIKPNTVSNQVFHIVDLYPTLLGIAGGSLEQKLPLDGIDIKEALLENKPISRKELLLYSVPRGGTIRVGDWKVVISGQNNPNRPQGVKKELFNIKDDPYEQNDLAASNPEKLQELLERYEFYAKQSVPPLNKPIPADFKAPEIWGNFD
jgi:arylsulfatase A-like enzyme